MNGQADVDLRIETISWASVSNFLDIDNIQVNAVPEPGSFVLGLSVLASGWVLVRRRRSEKRGRPSVGVVGAAED